MIPSETAVANPAPAADPCLRQVRRGGVLVLTLDRPERRNALSLPLYESLLVALQAAARDDEIGAVVLTGAGPSFCAGGDVVRMASNVGAPPAPFEVRLRDLRRRTGISELLHAMPKPTIAMIRGHAIGAGLSLALACDMRYADTTARLRTGFVDVGLSGDFGAHYFLPRLVGAAKARELLLTSPMLDAPAAAALGLLNGVFEPDGLETAVMDTATRLAQGPRAAIAHIKDNLNEAAHLRLDEVLDRECWRQLRCMETPDHHEAARAFAEKRPPRFA
ncbi:enoyl-CoA hydratase [Bordetella genomosp. 8]|uniref:enoyl-CoA hydratase n=1 Tax=Bordetella genomosp. 8 TaxID=1416806 RepID=UPI001E3A02F7|nr:enoyl-CoA hydratase [Bordetella genomosp. 8]